MARKLNEYQRLVSKRQRELRRDATPQERAACLRQTAEEWRRLKGGRPVQSNPSSNDIVKWAIIAGVAYFGYQMLQASSQCQPSP